MGGTFYVQYFSYIDPGVVFDARVSVNILSPAIIGGVGTVLSPVVGAFILIPLSELPSSLFVNYRGLNQMIYSVLLIIVIIFLPNGVKVILMGHDVTAKSPHAICQLGLARTFQITKPFGNLPTLENVMVGAFKRTNSYQEAEKVAIETLKFVGLNFKRDVQTKEMTIGDQRRLELARALATNPKFLLLDEVMAGLTPSEVSKFMEIIRKIRQNGITILMIEHISDGIIRSCFCDAPWGETCRGDT